jgi:hypothetical protein
LLKARILHLSRLSFKKYKDIDYGFDSNAWRKSDNIKMVDYLDLPFQIHQDHPFPL